MPLQKICKTCGHKKGFDHFSIVEGTKRKPKDNCKQCEQAVQAGLNPTPDLSKKVDEDADLKRRKRLYRQSIERRRQGMDA